MSQSLVKSLQQSLQVSSLRDLVRVKQNSNIMMLLDCSGSMACYMANGRKRIDGLRDTVRSVQAEHEMKMIQFGNGAPCFVNHVPDPSGGTPLHEGIDFARSVEAGRLLIISDGEPDSRSLAMQAARRFGGRIDVVFVGDEGSSGEAFLRELANVTGGDSFTGDLQDPKQLTGRIIGLLGVGSAEDEDEEED